jgi:hypothetical protein
MWMLLIAGRSVRSILCFCLSGVQTCSSPFQKLRLQVDLLCLKEKILEKFGTVLTFSCSCADVLPYSTRRKSQNKLRGKLASCLRERESIPELAISDTAFTIFHCPIIMTVLLFLSRRREQEAYSESGTNARVRVDRSVWLSLGVQ